MRTLSPTERSNAAARRKWVFTRLEVTNPDSVGIGFVSLLPAHWSDVGALSAGGSSAKDFFNTATITDSVDANSLTFNATLKREYGNMSLSPFRSDSALNASSLGLFAPMLDLNRYWRLWIAVMPEGVPADTADYREVQCGIVNTIDVNDDEEGTITLTGRGMEGRLLDAYIATSKDYGDDTSPVDLEDVLQQMLDDKLGAGEVTLYTPVSPSFGMVKWTQAKANLMPAMATAADLAAYSLRYLYDSADVNRLTLFSPPRNTSTVLWSIGPDEYETIPQVRIDLTNVKTYIKLTYADKDFGIQTLTSPTPEASTVSCTAGAATFSSSAAGLIDDGAKIVVDEVEYVVSAFDGTTGCTLTPAATFATMDWITSAAITRYGLRILDIDLSADTKVVTQTSAGNLIDAIRSDCENPALEQQIVSEAVWWQQLNDYVQIAANGIHYDTDQFGAVVGYTMSFEDGTLVTTLNFSAKPKGRYADWLALGKGSPRTPLVPKVLSLDAKFKEITFGLLRLPLVTFVGNVDQYTKSAFVELSQTIDFAVVDDSAYVDTDVASKTVSGFFAGVLRDIEYFVRMTPYTGPVISGVSTGVVGLSVIDSTFVQFEVPSKPQFDVLDATVAGIAGADVLVKTASGALSAERVVTDSTDIVADWATPSQVAFRFAQDMATQAELNAAIAAVGSVGVALSRISVKEIFVNIEEDDSGLHGLLFTAIPASEVEIHTAYRRQRILTGLGFVRFNANIKAKTGTPTIKLKYTINAFGAVADIATWVPTGTGLQSSGFIAVPAGAQVDVGMTIYLADGAGTASIEFYELDVEFVPATVSSARIHTPAFAAAYV
jgi:hypothetical protein